MSKPALRLSAAVLTTLIIIVGFSALDHLPGGVKAQIESDRHELSTVQSQLTAAQAAVSRDQQSDPGLFQSIPATHDWPSRFQHASETLQSANQDMEELTRLEKGGHHRDQPQVESLLFQERELRSSALHEAQGIQKEADQWLERKRHLPEALQAMEADYQSVHNFDLSSVKNTVSRAETDWPDKKADLDARLAAVTGIETQADQLWASSAPLRRQAASGDTTGLNWGALFAAGDEWKKDKASLSDAAADLQSRTGQLYDSWDKVLVDMKSQDTGGRSLYEQKIRTVRTHQCSTTSDEQWVQVPQPTYDADRNDLGMAIEHKPAGKYDSEADKVAQPAGFAYMAPPSQGSNQYGYWDHRDGGQSFWVWYGQYALLRDLLFNRSYRPLDRSEWEDFRNYRSRGETYYGRDFESGDAPKYGSNGTSTQRSYSGSDYAKRGGFQDSPYASHSGTYRNSPYASRSAEPDGDHSGHTFGSRPRPEEPHVAPNRTPSFHPSPRPMPRFPSGGGRRFGRH